MQKPLSKTLEVNKEKCVNCHRCISVCPVKFCNDGSGDFVKVNLNACIACGNCISACTHGARISQDDFVEFISDLEKGENIIVIVAPSIATNFPENYLRINGWLKNNGVQAIFDVSFGAELATYSISKYLQANPQLNTLIANPCAAIVTYLQIYQPELIKYLPPLHSPMGHLMIMIREFYPEFSNHKIAVISPCNAKKREFEEIKLGNYNVSMQSIAKFLTINNINLNNFNEEPYLNPQAERAVCFPKPGGFLQTLERHIPGTLAKSRKIDGIPVIYPYLSKLPEIISKEMSSFVIDCLSCENGCNAGPFTLNTEKSADEIEFWINKRNAQVQKFYLQNNIQNNEENIQNIINKYWKENIYQRNYQNLKENSVIEIPNEQEFKSVYKRMHKYTEKEMYNCASCGYNKCETMAIAIYNNLNKPENCHHYLVKEKNNANELVFKEKEFIGKILETSLEGFVQLNTEGILVKANQAMCNILKNNNIIGNPYWNFTTTEGRKTIAEQMIFRQKGHKSQYEIDFIQSDGNTITCLIKGTPLYEEGIYIGSFGMVTDITERKKAEKQLKINNQILEKEVNIRTEILQKTLSQLQEHQEKFQQQNKDIENQKQILSNILQFFPDPLFIIDENGVVTFWNNAMEALTGRKSSDIIGLGNMEYSIPFYGYKRNMLVDLMNYPLSEIEKNYTNVEKTGEIIKGELYLPRFGQNGTYFSATVAPLYANNRRTGTIEIIRDITEKRKKDNALKEANMQIMQKSEELLSVIEELRTTNQIIEQHKQELEQQIEIGIEQNLTIIEQKKQLAESEEKYRSMVENLNDAIFTLNKHGIFTYISPSIHKFEFLQENNLLGKHFNSIIAPEQEHPFLFTQNLKDSQLVSLDFKLNNAEERWLRTKLKAVFHHENIIGYHGILTDITEKIKTEKILKESEERYSLAMQASTDGLCDWNFQTNEFYFSPSWKTMLGYTEKELPNNIHTLFELIYEDEKDEIITKLNNFMHDQSSRLELEFKLKHKNGDFVQILSRFFKQFDTNTQKVIRIVGTNVNISEMRKTEQMLRQAQIIAKLGNWEFDFKTNTFSWSDEINVITGLNHNLQNSDIQGIMNLIHPSDRKRLITQFRIAQEEHQIFDITNRIICPNGTLKYIHNKCQFDYSPSGQAVFARGISIDVTSRVLAEIEIRKSREKYRILAENISDVIWLIDAEAFIFSYISPSITKLSGYTSDELTDTSLLQILFSESSVEFLKIMQEEIQKTKTHKATSEKVFQFQLKKKDGNFVWTEVTTSFLLNNKNEITGILGVFRGIEERKKSELELLKSQYKLSQQNKQITESIEYASYIQEAILPNENVLEKTILEHFVFFSPRDVVSGDFYYFTQMQDNVLIVAADCTGHGVPGALMSMLGIAFLNELSGLRRSFSASEALNFLRDRVKKVLQQNTSLQRTQDGIDMALCIVNQKTKQMQYAGANIPLQIIKYNKNSEKELHTIKPDKRPVGVHPLDSNSFTNHIIELKSGDTFYIASDGYISQFGGPTADRFKTKNYLDLLRKIQTSNMNEQKIILETTLRNWQGEHSQIDDILVMGFRIKDS